MTDSPTRQDWFFTFGSDHRLNGMPLSRRFVRIHGTSNEARALMVEHFGKGWAFQYASAEEAGVQRHDLTELRLEAAANGPAPAIVFCEYEGCDQDPEVMLPGGARMCRHHAVVSLLTGMRLSEARFACAEGGVEQVTPADPPKVTSEEDQKAHPDSIDPSCPDCVGFPCPEHQPLRAVERVVHQLDAGRALCGKRGVPGEWGPRHVWVSIHQGPVSAVNCPGCLLVRDRPGVVTALVGLARRALAWRSQGSRSKWTTSRSQALADEVDLMKERYPTFFEEFAADVQNAGAVVLDGPSGAQPELQVECSCGEIFAPMQCPRCERRHPPIVMAQRPMVWRAESGTYREVEPEEYTDAPPYKRTAELLRKFVLETHRLGGASIAAGMNEELVIDLVDAFEAEDLEQ